MTYPFAKFAKLQQAATRSLSYHDEQLVEAIMHHCALKVASATAPTDALVGRYVDAEIKAKHKLLRLPVGDIEGVNIRGRYFRALSACEEWEKDHGTMQALVDGMAGKGAAQVTA